MKIEINEDELDLLIRSLRFEYEMRKTVSSFIAPSRTTAIVLLQKLKDVEAALSAERGRKLLEAAE